MINLLNENDSLIFNITWTATTWYLHRLFLN